MRAAAQVLLEQCCIYNCKQRNTCQLVAAQIALEQCLKHLKAFRQLTQTIVATIEHPQAAGGRKAEWKAATTPTQPPHIHTLSLSHRICTHRLSATAYAHTISQLKICISLKHLRFSPPLQHSTLRAHHLPSRYSAPRTWSTGCCLESGSEDCTCR